MIQIIERLIQNEITVCPYCGSEQYSSSGCCGESSAHFETAYVYQDEIILESEAVIVKGPILRHWLWEIECFVLRQTNSLRRRIKSRRGMPQNGTEKNKKKHLSFSVSGR